MTRSEGERGHSDSGDKSGSQPKSRNKINMLKLLCCGSCKTNEDEDITIVEARPKTSDDIASTGEYDSFHSAFSIDSFHSVDEDFFHIVPDASSQNSEVEKPKIEKTKKRIKADIEAMESVKQFLDRLKKEPTNTLPENLAKELRDRWKKAARCDEPELINALASIMEEDVKKLRELYDTHREGLPMRLIREKYKNWLPDREKDVKEIQEVLSQRSGTEETGPSFDARTEVPSLYDNSQSQAKLTQNSEMITKKGAKIEFNDITDKAIVLHQIRIIVEELKKGYDSAGSWEKAKLLKTKAFDNSGLINHFFLES
jgi:hypothetical protein